jgi:hypothetical protein
LNWVWQTIYLAPICSIQEEKLRDKPGYEHLNEHLHVLIEAEQVGTTSALVDAQLNRARDIIEDLLKPVVCYEVSELLLRTFQCCFEIVFDLRMIDSGGNI